MSHSDTGELERSFAQIASRLRGRLWLRRVLVGGALGLCAGAAVAGVCWWFGQGAIRPYSAAAGLLGVLGGALWYRRARWSDQEVALYVDRQLGSNEQVVTALGVAGATSEAAEHLRRTATQTLAQQSASLRLPRVWDSLQLTGPLGAAAIAFASWAPLPKPAPHITPPGIERLQRKDVKGLERIEALKDKKGRNPEDERRMRALAEEAKKLRGELARGVEKREALSKLSKLRDSIAELRSDFAQGQNRAGLEAAIGALAEREQMRKAARALGDGDITGFDKEMQRLANQAERESRESAKKALEEAERAAREKGAQGLADALKEQRELFDQRSAEADALRELAQALGNKLDPDALEDLKELGQNGDPEAAKRLAEAMGKALSQLSEEERKRLAEQLQKRLEKSGGDAGSPMSKQEMEDLARRLASPEGQRELAEQLKELANPKPASEAERDGALGDAERGMGEAERDLGGMPIPMGGGPTPGEGQGAQQGNGNGSGKSSGNSGKDGGPGSHHDTGTGDHAGESKQIDASELRAKAHVTRSGVGPMHAATQGRAPARPGDTANQRGTGSLGSVAPGEVGAIEQSEVPEDYREHVGRYFEP